MSTEAKAGIALAALIIISFFGILWFNAQASYSNLPSPSPSPCQILIKGNVSARGEKIYHMPYQKYYDVTVIELNKGERYFCSEQEAQKAGWRKSKI